MCEHENSKRLVSKEKEMPNGRVARVTTYECKDCGEVYDAYEWA